MFHTINDAKRCAFWRLLRYLNESGSANYTLIHTNGDFGGTTSRSTDEVPGFIPRTGNATLSWRYRKFSTRILYNFTSSYITAFTAATPGRNLYRFQYATVNAGVSYQVRPNLQLTLDAANLTNEPQSLYRGVRSQMQNTILIFRINLIRQTIVG
jgi:outer membrane receptor protein involved in Fe transport